MRLASVTLNVAPLRDDFVVLDLDADPVAAQREMSAILRRADVPHLSEVPVVTPKALGEQWRETHSAGHGRAKARRAELPVEVRKALGKKHGEAIAAGKRLAEALRAEAVKGERPS